MEGKKFLKQLVNKRKWHQGKVGSKTYCAKIKKLAISGNLSPNQIEAVMSKLGYKKKEDAQWV